MRPFKIDVARNMLNGVTEIRFSFTGDPSESEVPTLMSLQYGSDATAQLKALVRLCVSLIETEEKAAAALQKMTSFGQKNWGGLVPQPPVQHPDLNIFSNSLMDKLHGH